MNKKPLLIFPTPTNVSRSSLGNGYRNFSFPTKENQVQRFEEKITELDRVLKNKTLSLTQGTVDITPEMILVLEVAGEIIDFYKAVEKTSGMEFLAENKDTMEPNEYFHALDKDGNKTEKAFETRFYLTMTNQRALKELKKYWDEYKKEEKDQKFKTGVTKFRALFEQLIDIRFYSVEDRVRDTGLERQISDLKKHGLADKVKFEIELAFKGNSGYDYLAYQEVVRLLNLHGGRAIENSRINLHQISYHAFIAEAPIQVFDDLTENTQISFLKSQQILFFRPVGQMVFKQPEEEIDLPDSNYNDIGKEPTGNATVALLDGLPLENHSLLRNRIHVDDPDGFSNNYIGSKRYHGTGMASLIVHGDLDDVNTTPLSSPLYVRPIMQLTSGYTQGESLPDDRLPIDLVHLAVKRMKRGENGQPATAPDVKIINFSIGDPDRPFHNTLSSWARLLDWLSYEYDILFVVSSGNQGEDLELDIPIQDFDKLSKEEVEFVVLRHLVATNFKRKILTPAESINALTVGASHQDYSEIGDLFQNLNLIQSTNLLSPMSRIGFGYRKSIKPDILMPGGRKLYRKYPFQSDQNKTLLRLQNVNVANRPPGNKIALPGLQGDVNKVGYSWGTSNAAALTTRLGAQLYEVLRSLRNREGGEILDEKYFTVLIKSLLVHSASWGTSSDTLLKIIKDLPGTASNTIKKNLLPYLGYGEIDPQRILFCTNERVTLLGCGHLKDSQAHLFRFPLPPSISSKKLYKKLTITLAYNSPLNHQSYKYRKAHLFFDNLETENEHLRIQRPYYDFRASRLGTVQHDILIGDNADAFIDGDSLAVKVSCREDASGLKNHLVKYGLAVTLEMKEGVGVQIYEEIKQRIRTKIRQKV